MDNTDKILCLCEALYALMSLWRKYTKQVESICAVMREQGIF